MAVAQKVPEHADYYIWYNLPYLVGCARIAFSPGQKKEKKTEGILRLVCHRQPSNYFTHDLHRAFFPDHFYT